MFKDKYIISIITMNSGNALTVLAKYNRDPFAYPRNTPTKEWLETEFSKYGDVKEIIFVNNSIFIIGMSKLKAEGPYKKTISLELMRSDFMPRVGCTPNNNAEICLEITEITDN